MVTVAFVRVPQRALGPDVDSSWCAVLDYAQQHGLQFGRDVDFTYGPLGYLVMPGRPVRLVTAQLVVTLALGCAVTLGICLLSRRWGGSSRILLMAGYIWLTANMHAGADLLFAIGFLAWGCICLRETGPMLPVYLIATLALTAFGALTRITLVVSSVAVIICISLDLFLRSHSKFALGLLGGFGLSIWLGWECCGQQWAYFGSWIRNGLAFSTAYDQTMAKPLAGFALGVAIMILIMAGALIVIGLLARTFSRSERWRRVVWALWLWLVLFMSWKHGMVRADELHVEIFFGFAAMLVLVLERFASDTKSIGFRVAGSILYVLCFSTLMSVLGLGPMDYCFAQPWVRLKDNVEELAGWDVSLEKLKTAEAEQRSAISLPRLKQHIGNEPVDVFGNNQVVAVFNQLNYLPRPVFCSFAAYTPRLMQLNEEVFRASKAPRFVLFRLNAIDHRVPALEDSLVLRVLLTQFDLVDEEKGFLLLKRKTTAPADLNLLREGWIRPGERIPLEEYGGTNLWMELELRPTVAGRLRQLLYKAPEVRLTIVRGHGKSPAVLRAPAPMMASGFMASPFLLRSEDVVEFYQHQEIPRPTGYLLNSDSGDRFWWESRAKYRIFGVANSNAER